MIMKVHFVTGISGDRVEVKIFENEDIIFEKVYFYGYNASWSRKSADFAHRDHEDAIKYGWDTTWHTEKPFIGDILQDLAETYTIADSDIIYTGYMVFAERDMTEEEVMRRIDKIKEELQYVYQK